MKKVKLAELQDTFLDALLEAILFDYGPISRKNIVEKFSGAISEDRIKNGIFRITAKYEGNNSGVMVMNKNGHYYFGVRPKFLKYIRKMDSAKCEVFEYELSKKELTLLAKLVVEGPLKLADLKKLLINDVEMTLARLREINLVNFHGGKYEISYYCVLHFGFSSKKDFREHLLGVEPREGPSSFCESFGNYL